MKKLLFMLIITTVGMGFLGCEKELIEPPENPDEFVDYAFQVEGAYRRIEIWDAVLGDYAPIKWGGIHQQMTMKPIDMNLRILNHLSLGYRY